MRVFAILVLSCAAVAIQTRSGEAKASTRHSGFIQLPASGTGFYSYTSPGRRWGTSRMIYGIIKCGKSWKSAHPGWARFGVGDISLRYGGYMSGHVSHRNGVDADFRPMRISGEGPTVYGTSSYSREKTKALLVNHVKPSFSVRVVFFNDPALYKPYSWIQYWKNHANHFHLRIW